MSSLLKLGSKGTEVVELQTLLGIDIDGLFGEHTKASVIEFQEENDLQPDGIVGTATWGVLKGHNPDGNLDSDANVYVTDNGMVINKYYLPNDEYVHERYDNEYAFLHHTAGRENPYRVVDSWGRDDRGRVGTEFVLGGISHTSGNSDYDGEMIQAFPEGNFAYHLGAVGSSIMRKASVGVEICSMGYLDNDYKTYVNSKCLVSQACKLSEPFKNRIYWNKYSDKQLEQVGKWIEYIGKRDSIDMRVGLQQWIMKYGPTKAFDFHQDAYDGKVKGLLTHTNVRKDKYDCFPDPGLVDVIMSIR
tara:strand:- start:1032 stop:1940 length:909 start_codon:yes stop_codon:yes gene_type:complete